MKRFEDFSVVPSDLPNHGFLFVNHEPINRSGHLGHALAQMADGEILAFNPNCSAGNGGHSGDGWMDIKRSRDGGDTWTAPEIEAYSYDMWRSGCGATAMAEKAVVTDTGRLVLFHLICDMTVNGSIWEPYLVPTVNVSSDAGRSWSEAKSVCPYRGRVYDALYRDGTILALVFCNDAAQHYAGVSPEHLYRLYESTDDGETFVQRSVVGLPTGGRCYGTMAFLENGDLIVYCYDIADEAHPDYCVSHDLGRTWDAPGKAVCAKKIRNPQLAAFGGGYFMHGRSGSMGEGAGSLVLYYAPDAVHWDEGRYMCMQEAGTGCYSNNLVARRGPNRWDDRLLILSSHAYHDHQTNVLAWWIEQKR